MTQIQDKQKQPQPSEAPPTENLARAIELAMERRPDEQVRAVLISGKFYRVNWWVNDNTHPMFISSGRIRRSEFIKATRTGSGLLIEPASSR